ncbi:ABC transporter permease [Opitutaceae bacterium TAV4]|uniref:ABC transporter permease n=1 Tax=Geminisphaera colitermitum TaxID=1148786 RepID=UPI000158D47B|nr:ABC transporter permease [Geminisphaera colitermitum]RRJ94998.1 ABC transporter permease [Opitutaceae bacterium TAV4]RRJ98876.1 ABC transporter permease [Opitutaceae bacterium TAV3]
MSADSSATSAPSGDPASAVTTKRPRIPSGLKLMEWGFGAWTALVFVFLYAPIIVLMVYSFNTSRLNILWQGFTTKWYGELVRNRPIMEALTNSIIVAIITTIAAVILGTTGAWLLYRYRYRFARSIQTLICVPMIMPEIVMGISLLIFFTVLSLPLGFLTVSIAHVTFCFPFVLVAVQARLQGLDPSLEEAALDLGATPLRAFWLVIVPCLRPAILSGGLMAFTLSMDELIVSFFTVGPDSRTLPLLVFGMAKVGLNPMLNALSAIFVITTAAFVLFSEYLRRIAQRR